MEAAKRPLLLRLIEDYWGVLLVLVAWQLWVVIGRFNVIVMPTPLAVLDAPEALLQMRGEGVQLDGPRARPFFQGRRLDRLRQERAATGQKSERECGKPRAQR